MTISESHVLEVAALHSCMGPRLEDDAYDLISSLLRYSSFRVVIFEWDANNNLDGCVDFFTKNIIHPKMWGMEVEYAGTSFGLRYTFTHTTSSKGEHDNVRMYLDQTLMKDVYSTYDFWFW